MVLINQPAAVLKFCPSITQVNVKTEMPLRSKTKHFSLGTPDKLPERQLPTNKDVVNYIRLIHSGPGKVRREMSTIFKPVAEKVITIWVREGIPVIQELSVYKKVAECYKKFQELNKTKAQNRDGKRGKSKMNERYFGELFDIARCKCRSERCCKCPYENRVPRMEAKFLRDQRGPRKMFMGMLDHQETSRRRVAAVRRRQRRQEQDPETSSPMAASSEPGPSGLQHLEASSSSATSSTEPAGTEFSDMDWTEEDGAQPETGERNFERLTNTALAADRCGVPHRSVCAIVNGFQQDIGRISETNTKLVVDPMKIYRERERVRSMAASARAEQHGHIEALYFDGRKDQTFTGRSSTRKEEHVAVVVEPGSTYLTHFTPESGRAIHQARHLTDIAIDNNADVRVLGCDGTAVNTGRDGGICRLFEVSQDSPRAVHWFVCQLHANELCLRAVFHKLDGSTTGPKSFSGPLGRAASGEVHRLETASFRAVTGPLPDLPDQLVADLSTDQQLLYRLARGVQDGKLLDSSDGHRQIGPVNHARYVGTNCCFNCQCCIN